MCVSALTREKEIKKWRREKKDALVVSVNPEWKDFRRRGERFLPAVEMTEWGWNPRVPIAVTVLLLISARRTNSAALPQVCHFDQREKSFRNFAAIYAGRNFGSVYSSLSS